nr:hypothetical protein [uncultured Rhodopila sp.]
MRVAIAIVLARLVVALLGNVIGLLIPKDRIKDWLLFCPHNGEKP